METLRHQRAPLPLVYFIQQSSVGDISLDAVRCSRGRALAVENE